MTTRFPIREEGPLLIAEVGGRVSGDEARDLFADLYKRLSENRALRSLVYEATGMERFEPSVIVEAKSSAKLIDALGVRIVVVSTKGSVRFALSAIQLVMRGKLSAAATLDEARKLLGA